MNINNAKKVIIVLCVAFIVAAVFFVSDWRSIGNMLASNQKIIKMVIPFTAAIFYLAYKKYRNPSFLPRISLDTLLTLSGIFLTVLLFAFQSYNTNSETLLTIIGMNTYNCKLASTLVERIGSNKDYVPAGHFITDYYQQKIGFMFNHGGTTAGSELEDAIFNLNDSNQLIDFYPLLLAGNHASTTLATLNSQIASNANDFVRSYCAKLPIVDKFPY